MRATPNHFPARPVPGDLLPLPPRLSCLKKSTGLRTLVGTRSRGKLSSTRPNLSELQANASDESAVSESPVRSRVEAADPVAVPWGVGRPARPTPEARDGASVLPLPVDREVREWKAFLPERASGLRWWAGQAFKRAMDFVLALVGSIALLPLLLVIAVVVKLTSKGPALYRSTYVGYRGRPFVGYKFRSMVQNANELKAEMGLLNHMRGPAFKIRNDPRVTPVGRFLRKFSIDELPQLWNVIRGEMSLVGPRPPLPEEYEQFAVWQRGKLAVRPGITCFWQIQGRSEISDFAEWARLDLAYIDAWSLWTDLKILLRTIPAVFWGHGAY